MQERKEKERVPYFSLAMGRPRQRRAACWRQNNRTSTMTVLVARTETREINKKWAKVGGFEDKRPSLGSIATNKAREESKRGRKGIRKRKGQVH